MTDFDLRLMILGTIFVVALITESVWPLRRTTISKTKRIIRNLSIAGISAILVRFAFLPLEIWAANFATEAKLGLMNLVHMHPALRIAASLILLEYTFYFWHYLNHRTPFLWRFHNVHHTDLDLDVSTASRFHFGELAISAIYRIGQIFIIGIDVPTLLLFEAIVVGFSQFHHANIRLPERFDSWLATVIVTPRMHGIHHSIIRNETDSNYGTVFTFWDRMHGTLKLRVPQNEIIIGVPSYRLSSEQSVASLLIMPFQKQRKWQLPTGQIPNDR